MYLARTRTPVWDAMVSRGRFQTCPYFKPAPTVSKDISGGIYTNESGIRETKFQCNIMFPNEVLEQGGDE
jgi:hypothetical protein